MGTQIFKFKKSIEDTQSLAGVVQSPSLIETGTKGERGRDGEDGTSIFFANYDLRTSYYKKLALQRISNGYAISSNAGASVPVNRPYKDGDIIISRDMSCYRISLKDGQYDITSIGRMNVGNNMVNYPEITGVNITYIGGCTPVFRGRHITHRLMQEEPDVFSQNKEIYIEITPTVQVADIDSDIYEKYEVSLEIELPNTKSMGGDFGIYSNTDSYVVQPSTRNLMNFSKIIEYPIEEIPKTYKMCEVEADLLHLYGNDVTTTIANNGHVAVRNIYDSSNVINAYYVKNSSGEMYTSVDDSSFDLDTFVTTRSYNDTSTAIKYSRYDSSAYNFRGGESSYFSSYPASVEGNVDCSLNAWIQADTSIIKSSRPDFSKLYERLKDFIFSPYTKYTLILVNKESRDVARIDVSEIVNISAAE